MRIFSNGQFDNNFEFYVFDPKTEMFSKLGLGQKADPNSVFLMYKARKPQNWEDNAKKFELTLVRNGKSVKKESGAIYKAGHNDEYYDAVEAMRKEAIRLSS